MVPYARPLTDDLAKAVAAALEHSDAVILERHGTVAVGRTVAEAYGQTERIEHASQVLWSAYALAAPRPVDEAEQRALLRMYESSRLKR